MGRARKTLTEDELQDLERLSSVGCTQGQMAGFLGVSEKTLTSKLDATKDARERIARAKIDATARVAGSLYRRALDDGDVGAQKAWLAAQGGPAWRPDAPQTNVTVNLSAALQDLNKVIEGEASETGRDPTPLEAANLSKGYIDQDVTDDLSDAGDIVNSNDRYIVSNALRQIKKWQADPDDA